MTVAASCRSLLHTRIAGAQRLRASASDLGLKLTPLAIAPHLCGPNRATGFPDRSQTLILAPSARPPARPQPDDFTHRRRVPSFTRRRALPNGRPHNATPKWVGRGPFPGSWSCASAVYADGLDASTARHDHVQHAELPAASLDLSTGEWRHAGHADHSGRRGSLGFRRFLPADLAKNESSLTNGTMQPTARSSSTTSCGKRSRLSI